MSILGRNRLDIKTFACAFLRLLWRVGRGLVRSARGRFPPFGLAPGSADAACRLRVVRSRWRRLRSTAVESGRSCRSSRLLRCSSSSLLLAKEIPTHKGSFASMLRCATKSSFTCGPVSLGIPGFAGVRVTLWLSSYTSVGRRRRCS